MTGMLKDTFVKEVFY